MISAATLIDNPIATHAAHANLINISTVIVAGTILRAGAARLTLNSAIVVKIQLVHGASAVLVCSSTTIVTACQSYSAHATLTCISASTIRAKVSYNTHAILGGSSALASLGSGLVSFMYDTFENGVGNWVADNPLTNSLHPNSVQYVSPVHSITGSNGQEFFTFQYADNNNGNIHINAWVYITSGSPTLGGIVWRGALSPLGSANNTFYFAYIQYAASQERLLFGKNISGTTEVLATVTPTLSGSLNDAWMNLDVRMKNTLLMITVQDQLGNYLTAGGILQPSFAAAVDTSDSSISGSGYFGMLENNLPLGNL